jgi:hypothetical protein
MLRRILLSFAVSAIAASPLFAAEIRGTVKSVDPAKSSVTVMVGNQEKVIQVAKNCPVYGPVTLRLRRTAMQQVGTGVGTLQKGMIVTVITSMRDGVEQATEITEDNVTFDQGTGGGGRLPRIRRFR